MYRHVYLLTYLLYYTTYATHTQHTHIEKMIYNSLLLLDPTFYLPVEMMSYKSRKASTLMCIVQCVAMELESYAVSSEPEYTVIRMYCICMYVVLSVVRMYVCVFSFSLCR